MYHKSYKSAFQILTGLGKSDIHVSSLFKLSSSEVTCILNLKLLKIVKYTQRENTISILTISIHFIGR